MLEETNPQDDSLSLDPAPAPAPTNSDKSKQSVVGSLIHSLRQRNKSTEEDTSEPLDEDGTEAAAQPLLSIDRCLERWDPCRSLSYSLT